jgi:dephospho-CoA kinase
MKIIGLTGGIGMGKTTVANMLLGFGFPVWKADDAVHDLYTADGAAVAPVAALFPGKNLLNDDGSINTDLLGKVVSENSEKLAPLEAIVHPLVKESQRAFIQKAREANARAVILEIPLLFETKTERDFDIILCVTAPPEVQKERVSLKPNMTPKKFAAFLERQLPDAEKCAKANYVINTGVSLAETENSLRTLFGGLGLLDSQRPTGAPPTKEGPFFKKTAF